MCGIPMKRTTVKISGDLDARVRHEAERRGVTVVRGPTAAVGVATKEPHGATRWRFDR